MIIVTNNNKIKMKNLILLAAALLITLSAQAQNTDVVNLSIELRAIQTITVNPLQKEVKLIYDSVEKYEGGIISNQSEHLEIFSSGGFAVQVSSTAFELDEIKIIADPVQPNPTYSFFPVDLTEAPTDLIVGGRGGRQKFNVTYDNSEGAGQYFDKEYKTYSTEVTYTITAR